MRRSNTWMQFCLKLFSPLALLFGLGACSNHQQIEGAIGSPVQDKLATLRYWTPERMKDAEWQENDEGEKLPASPPMTPGGDIEGHAASPAPHSQNFISRVTGEFFYFDPVGNKNRHCGAAVIESGSKRLLITAAHCVIAPTQDPPLVWNQYPMFVPAYDGNRPVADSQRAPYGLWPIRRTYIAASLEEKPGDVYRNDLDVAVVAAHDQLSKRIEEVLGGGLVPVMSHQDSHFAYVSLVGYPAVGRYQGATQYWCLSETNPAPSVGVKLQNCSVRFGHSGSPILSVEDASQPWEARSIVAIAQGASQPRLLPTLYPYLFEMADSDNP